MDISWNGTVWAVLDNENGSYLTLVTSDGHVSEIPLRVNGTPCGLAWNGSQWIVETFIPDRVEIQTLNGSVLFRIHSYDCKGFAYLNGTYYVPISESAMMGDCSLVQVSGEGKIKGTAPCGFINGVKVKVVEGRIYLMNCTGIYVYSDGRFEQVQRLENCTSDFDFLKDKTLLCSIGLIEHSKNTTRKILSSCDAIGCSGRECLVAANGTLYTYDGSLKTLEIENHANHSGSTLKKALSLGALLALLVGLFLCRRRPF
ncbi:hypothetical protein [Thermococcus henrietii]|uniref:hypothetical protein n=1 Tax=Thermococcus henrietii TaxID=2016361 RepID=UPI0011AB7734|nr:hypothetical protein [Thermococcus henrietii]